MSDLPAKQSAFSKIRNNILNFGLKNKFTRGLMANTLPNLLGYSLVNYVLNNDDQDFNGTLELIASMRPKSIESNFSTIFRIINQRNINYEENSTEKFINRILDTVNSESADIISRIIIKTPEYGFLERNKETSKRLGDSIDCQNKTPSEMNSLLDSLTFKYDSNIIAQSLFENLTLEQKKEYFSKFASIVKSKKYYDEHILKDLFEQFPEEDRFEQYINILNVYGDKNNTSDLSDCFVVLSEEEKKMVLERTVEQIISIEDEFKGTSLSTILRNISVEEQEKYYKEILKYCDKDFQQMHYYVSSLDKSLHSKVAFDVISKVNQIIKNDRYGIKDYYYAQLVLENLDKEVLSNAFVGLINGSLENPDLEFIVELLSETDIGEYLGSSLNNNQPINGQRLVELQEKGYDVKKLTLLVTNLECNRILNELPNNLDEKSYLEAIQEISGLAKNIKTKDTYYYSTQRDFELIFEKKLDTYLELFSKLDDKDKAKFFQDTITATLEDLTQFTSLNKNVGIKLKELYVFLDKENQISQFSTLLSCVNKSQGNNPNVIEFINDIVQTMDSNSMDLIYSQYINMFNEESEPENYKNLAYALISDKFVEGIIGKISNNSNINFLNEEKLIALLNGGNYQIIGNKEKNEIVRIYLESRLNKIKNKYNNLGANEKNQNIDKILIEISNQLKNFDMVGNNYQTIIDNLKIGAINEIFYSVDKNERSKHFDGLYEALNNIKDKKNGFLLVFQNLDNEEKLQRFPEFFEQLKYDAQSSLVLYGMLENEDKIKIFEDFVKTTSPEKLEFISNFLKNYSIKDINEIFKGKITLEKEKIAELMSLSDDIAIKTLLFDNDVDREKIIDLSSYAQLQNNSINISSVIKNLYLKNKDKSIAEFNEELNDTYNLFTYNNVPEFMKNFRIFQLSGFYDKKNDSIKSFQGKTLEERDSIILEDLFKISLDSNNESLRDFFSILNEGKRLTTILQVNPEERIKGLSIEELALLNQYRDTLFDLHNITKEIRNTDRPRIEKSNDVIKDLKLLIATYSDNQEHNINSRNIVFNPNKIMDELFKGFITTSIRPKAMLEYMDRRKSEADERHLEIEKQLASGKMHLEEGDFIKGIQGFDEYIPSMLRDGIKGGEFNQEFSHSDATPLDADFGYISKGNLGKENATDYEIIGTTISSGYGTNYIVLKKYADRLQDRSRENIDQGTFTGAPDYYEMNGSENARNNSRYIRTGIPTLDIDYIVSVDWNPKNSYEMAMAGIYIPVINPKGEVVFSSEEFKKIREEMRGLSHYNAENIEVSKYAKEMGALYAVYRAMSSKSEEDLDLELEPVKSLVAGKKDEITEQKKNATTKFIREFFISKGINVTDDLSQNLSSNSIELIDTGSTGRGTNVPGDGDFDFMLRHNLPSEHLTELSRKVQELTPDKKFTTVGDGFRAKDVVLPTGEVVDIDITTAPKKLSLIYSSDMCVRDRLNNIKENDPESYEYVQANIIMAKKILKANGIYKKLGSDGASEHGGFGGIGVENWILQNGGSFKQAIDTFLEAAKQSSTYDEFKKTYPIFDFGFNHREGKIRHDRFSSFFANDTSKPNVGFGHVVETLTGIQKALELEQEKQENQVMQTPLIQSISPAGFEEAGKKRETLRSISSYSRVRSMISKYMSIRGNNENQINRSQDSLEEK